jgi:hypothetical protein
MIDETPSNPVTSFVSIRTTALWYGCFTLLVFGGILTIWALAAYHSAKLFSEDSPLEWAQFGLMVIACCVFIRGALKHLPFREICLVLASLPALAAIREQDAAFDRMIPALGWQLPFFLLLAVTSLYAIRHRTRLSPQCHALVNHRSFALMWAGFMVAIPFGQMIGHGQLMINTFGEDYQRTMKRMIEESAETIGYLMIFAASFDWTFSLCGKGRES